MQTIEYQFRDELFESEMRRLDCAKSHSCPSRGVSALTVMTSPPFSSWNSERPGAI